MSNYIAKVMDAGAKIRFVMDNWQNVFTGLGTARDKTQYGRFVQQGELSEKELTGLYHSDDTAKRLIAFKPQEMLRQGFTINVEDDADGAGMAVLKKLRELRAGRKMRDAMIWGRLYGGAAVFIGADDGQDADQPLNLEGIRSVKFLHVIDKRHLQPATVFGNPNIDEFFGEPETYRITPRRGAVNIVVHSSRLLLFGGAHTSDEERDRLGHWDHSILNHTYHPLRMFNNVFQAAEHLVSDMSQAVMKIKGLMEMIAGGHKDTLQTRMELVDISRSVARAMLLDADGETFERQDSTFTSLEAVLDKFMMRFAAAAELPVTLLMGRSPAGENATGESDFRFFYDTVRTSQEHELLPQLERLIEICFRAQDGPTNGAVPESWAVVFKELWQMTPSERADLEKKVAEKDKIYIDGGVLLPEEIALSRYRPDGFNQETNIDREVRKSMLEAELAAMPEEREQERVPEESEEQATEEPEEAEAGKVVLAPTDIAIVVTVNEARASQGLPPWPNPEEGKLTVSEFKARKEVEGEKIGEAVGAEQAEEIAPDAPAPTTGLPSPGDLPPEPPVDGPPTDPSEEAEDEEDTSEGDDE